MSENCIMSNMLDTKQLIDKTTAQFKKRRLRLNLTQEELAKKAGVTRLNVVYLESGKNVGLHTVLLVMQALGLTVSEPTGNGKAPFLQGVQTKRRVVHRKVDATKFPQLDVLLWDRHTKTITEEEAFYAYEKNAKFLDMNCADERELKFIKKLIDKYGNGVFL